MMLVALSSQALVAPRTIRVQAVRAPAIRMQKPAIRMQEEPAAEAAVEAAPAPSPPPPAASALALPTYDKMAYGNMAGGAMLTDIFNEGLKRLDNEDYAMPDGRGWGTSTEAKNRAGLEELAKKQNPILGFWDPLSIANDETLPETIGWFRHAEIKHGRVAMAGFVGYVIQENGIHFPWNIQGPVPGTDLTANLPAISFGDISAAGSPADQWDALPTAAKVQILCVVGFLEMCAARRSGRRALRAQASRAPRAQANESRLRPRQVRRDERRARARRPEALRPRRQARLLPELPGALPAPGAP